MKSRTIVGTNLLLLPCLPSILSALLCGVLKTAMAGGKGTVRVQKYAQLIKFVRNNIFILSILLIFC